MTCHVMSELTVARRSRTSVGVLWHQFHVHTCRCRPYPRAWLSVVVVVVVVAFPIRVVVLVAVVVVVVVVPHLFRRWDFPPASRHKSVVVTISSTLFLMYSSWFAKHLSFHYEPLH